MLKDIEKEYKKITQDHTLPTHHYISPEKQGNAIKKCSILKEVEIGYSNMTTFKKVNC